MGVFVGIILSVIMTIAILDLLLFILVKIKQKRMLKKAQNGQIQTVDIQTILNQLKKPDVTTKKEDEA